MKYKEAVEMLQGLTKFGINLGLNRIKCLLAYLGNPQDSLRVIHIGGTNGKGSTAAMIASILKEAGYTVGLFTSPHLHSYTERFQINGQEIDEEEFAILIGSIESVVKRVKEDIGESPTEFEILTALAFHYFLKKDVDVLVLEVGMGGDIDSTNVVKQPLLTIITNVSSDHQQYLGKSLEEIAKKKSGIIKKNCPIFTAEDNPQVLNIIRREAQVLQAPLYEIRNNVFWKKGDYGLTGQNVTMETKSYRYNDLFISLAGEHQLLNGATAVMAVECLKSRGWCVNEEHIRQGLAAVKWPGRLEVMSTRPLVVIDGAHNQAGMDNLAKWLRQIKPRIKRVILVIGMLDDKNRIYAASILNNLVDKIIVTKPSSLRTELWDEIREYFSKDNPADVIALEDVNKALERGLGELNPATDLLLVTGSLYLLGVVRTFFLDK